MPEYSQPITAYLNHQIDFDTLAAALFTAVDTDPSTLPGILTRLEEAKSAQPADLPLLQKLQRDLRDYNRRHTFPPNEHTTLADTEHTIIKGVTHAEPAADETKTAVQEITPERGDTVINSMPQEVTVIKPAAGKPPSAREEVTQVHPPPPTESLQPGKTTPGPVQKLEPGSVIKNRFVLEVLLGEGGMGRVFKARDLRKEEAQDRNPYVAVKVLNDSFKEHPQAFIALQREAKKAQSLAHPNIVTVFDFDRDGDTVYMTMEYLEGDSLDRMIRRQLPRPFDKPLALNIIKGICEGLSYAHKRNIIHSDLKPGNVFVTTEGEVKIFDFGIARAVHTSETGGEKTLFDVSSLGGLTPAYASCEMFEGQEPDARDDIYALACITYELLGGKHPFNKTPAVKARDKQLQVNKLPHLSRRQNKTINAALAFERQARIPSVDQFIEAITSRFSKAQKIAAVVLVALIIAAIISYEPLSNIYHQRRVQGYVTQIHSGDAKLIQATLKSLTRLPYDLRDEILEAAKEPLIDFYLTQAFNRIDIDKGLLDFNAAYHQLNVAAALYPDSAQITAARTKLQQRETLLSNELSARLNFHLQQGNLLDTDEADDVFDVLRTAARIDPKHPLLTDKRIAVTYAREAQDAANQWDFAKAAQLLDAAQHVVTGDNSLKALGQIIKAQEDQYRARQAKLAGQADAKALRRDVENLLTKPFSDAKWTRNVKAAMEQLEMLLPNNDSWLQDSKQRLAVFHLNRAENLRRQGKFGEARSALQSAEQFNSRLAGLGEEKTNLQMAQEQAMQHQKAQAQQQLVAKLKQQMLQEANNNNVAKATELLNQLRTMLDANDGFLQTDAPNALASGYARLGTHALQRGETDSAKKWITTGLEIVPQHSELLSLKAKLPTTPSDACVTSIAGYGRRTSCHDRFNTDDGREHFGPILVVVPGPRGASAFAIGKYELSVADYQLYCQASNRCSQSIDDSDLPLTNVSYQDIAQYLQWLSQQTGAMYRLPNRAEWMHAAKATSQPTGKDFNCRVMIGDDIVKGNALLAIKSGGMNSWGLLNYIGNAQELVLEASGQLAALGGAYQDPLAQCNITFSRAHDGKPDAITGFRVLREL